MRLSFYLKTLFVTFGLAAVTFAATPVVTDPLLENGETKVRPVLPTAKVLLFPVSAYDDGGKLTITATIDNPKVLVRVKTGNPLMKFVIRQAANGSDPTAAGYNPGFEETAVFQLFRDLAPETVGYIGGFAQGGFYDTGLSNKIHRVADFGPVTGQANDSFIFQGGSNTGTASGDIGYNFDNEFSTSAMFTGSGQIAMANAGYSSLQKGTNGSQYFITDGNVRQLDFKHTIFGQLTHGFAVLRKMRTAPRSNPNDGSPTVPIQVTSSSTVAQYTDGANVYTDAVLVISATAPGTSVITIKATNAEGVSGTQTFTVTAEDDPRSLNSRPFMTQLPDAVIQPSGQANLGFRVVDLERDYVPQKQTLVNNGSASNPNGISGFLGGTPGLGPNVYTTYFTRLGDSKIQIKNLFSIDSPVLAFRNFGYVGVIGNPTHLNSTGGFSFGRYTGPVFPTVSITQYEQTYRGSVDGGARGVDNASGATVAVGEFPLIAESTVISGQPGVAPASSFVVARYRDTDPKGKPTDITAKINWGDGSPLDTGTVGTDALKPSATGYQISGTHTYARAGTYDVVITITSPNGMRRFIRSTAVISASTLKAVGLDLGLPGPTIANPVLATFTDAGAATPASGYVATIDWGDGVVSPGTVKAAGPGRFSVVGRHTYLNAERFSLSIRVHRAGSGPEQDSIAWGSITLTRPFGVEHLPPFSMARLVAGIDAVPVNTHILDSPKQPTKATLGTAPNQQTYLTYSVGILNTGTKASKPGKLRFYLSLDKTVNTTAVGNNPADIPLTIKDLKTTEFLLPAVQPGAAMQYFFQKGPYADYRLLPPLNETGSGYNLLVQVDYSDPIADHLPIDKVTVDGKITGILVDKTFLATRESGTTDTFNLRLDKAPTATVNIPVTIASNGTTEGTLDKSSVTFTPSDWNTPHPVTVTGKRDTATSGGATLTDGTKTYQILIGFSTSADPLFNGMEGPPVLVSNTDRDGNLKLTNSQTTYVTTESAAPGSHSKNIGLTMNKKPTAPVTITIAASNNAEGKIIVVGGTEDSADPNKKILTFLPEDFQSTIALKSFTIEGVDDGVRDGDKTYTVSFVVQSNDPEFDGLYLPPLSITNTDDGTAPPTP
jgi:cyclophilin family peptidyl-prolyl cis-trans isomerase